MVVQIDVIHDFSRDPVSSSDVKVKYDRSTVVNPCVFAEKAYNFDKEAALKFSIDYGQEGLKLHSPNTELAFVDYMYRINDNFYANAKKGDWKFLNPRRTMYDNTESGQLRDLILGEITPAGMGSVTKTKNNEYIVLAKRSSNIQVPNSVINTPVGNLDWNQEKGGLYSFEERLQERAMVKVGWGAAYKPKNLLGVVRGRGQSLNLNFCFSAELDMKPNEIVDSLKFAQSTSKFADHEVILVEANRDSIVRAVKNYAPSLVDNGMGMLYLYFKSEFGDASANILKESVKDYFVFKDNVELAPEVDFI